MLGTLLGGLDLSKMGEQVEQALSAFKQVVETLDRLEKRIQNIEITLQEIQQKQERE